MPCCMTFQFFMNALVLVGIILQPKFELPSFITDAPKIKSGLHDPGHAIFRVVCHP